MARGDFDAGAAPKRQTRPRRILAYCGRKMVLTMGSTSNNGNQLITVVIGVFVAVCSWLVSHPADSSIRGIVELSGTNLILVVVVIGVSQWSIRRDIKHAAERLQEIESEINRLSGAELLKWETHWGGAVTGWFRRKPPLSN